jgi:sugar phosphate isomerase/epimerase
MKLGIVADELNRNFREAVRAGSKLGLRRYEIRFLQTGRAPMCAVSELLEIEQIIENEDVAITALSPGLFKWTADEKAFRAEMNEVFPRSVELAKRWGLGSLIVFGFNKPNATETSFYPNEHTPTYIFEWFAEVAEAAEKAEITLMIEPEPVCWMDTDAKLAELINKVNSDRIRVNYDPANVAWLTGKDPIDEFELIAPFIANVHIKDIKSTLPVWAVPGEGMIDYAKHFAALKKINYTGNISLEPHLDGSFEKTLLCKMAVENLWANEF